MFSNDVTCASGKSGCPGLARVSTTLYCPSPPPCTGAYASFGVGIAIKPRYCSIPGIPAGTFADRFCFAEIGVDAPWHFLNFFPLPQWQGSLRPSFWLLKISPFFASSKVRTGCRVIIPAGPSLVESPAHCGPCARSDSDKWRL